MKAKTVYLTGSEQKQYPRIVKRLRKRGYKVITSPSLSSYKKPKRVRVKPKGEQQMAKKKKSRKAGKKKSGGWLEREIVPMAIATVTEPILDQYANQLPIPQLAGIQADDLVKLGLGWYLGKKGGMMGKVAKYYGIFGAKNIISGLTGGLLGTGQQNTSAPGWV